METTSETAVEWVSGPFDLTHHSNEDEIRASARERRVSNPAEAGGDANNGDARQAIALQWKQTLLSTSQHSMYKYSVSRDDESSQSRAEDAPMRS